MTRGMWINRGKLSSVTRSRTAKLEVDASPKFTESKRTAVKNSVTRRNSGENEHDEGGEGVNSSRKKAASRMTGFMNGP